MTQPTINRRSLLGATALGGFAVALSGCTGVTRDKSQPHYVIVYDQNKCVGCLQCERACHETNHLPEGQFRLKIQADVATNDRPFVRVSCQQCEESPCVRACPTGAAHRDKATGVVTVDQNLCIGCKYCIVACPYNVRYIRKDNGAADHCNFCLDTRLRDGKKPACVEACPFDALAFGDLNDKNGYVARLLDLKDAVRIRPELGTRPSLRYIPYKQDKKKEA